MYLLISDLNVAQNILLLITEPHLVSLEGWGSRRRGAFSLLFTSGTFIAVMPDLFGDVAEVCRDYSAQWCHARNAFGTVP